MASWRRAGAFLLPSVVAAFAGALVTGLADGLLNTDTLLQAIAAAGFLGVYAIPIGLAVGLMARGLWRAWEFDSLLGGVTRETGGTPRLAAWLVFLIAAAWLLATVCFNSVFVLHHKTSAGSVVALSGAIAVVLAAALLCFCARPVVRGLSWAFDAVERATARHLGRSLLTPKILVIAAVVVIAATAYTAWLVTIRPRIGHIDLSFAYFLGLFGAVVVAVHLLWGAISGRRLLAAATSWATALAAVAAVSTAFYVRYHRPYSMLEVWGNAELAGVAVDMLFDIQSLRGELELAEFRPEERPGAPHGDVVLITIDTVRADRTPIYGGPVDMPALKGFAREGAVFQWAFSPGNVTRRSVPTIATGVSPQRIRGRVAGWALRLDPRHVLVAERFREGGYETAGFFCCYSQFGPRHRLGLIRGIDHLEINKDGMQLAALAREWLAERARRGATKPIFVWFHFIEPHLWNQTYPGKKHGSAQVRRYDMSLVDADRILAAVLKELWTDERRKHTYVVVTSDHGEGLGDRGSKFHASNLYNSQIRVPLVVGGPGIKPRRVPMPVGLVDLAPTLLDLAGFVPPGMPQMDGRSLAPILRGETVARLEEGEAYSVMVKDRSVEHSMWALVSGRHKVIAHDDRESVEVYDLLADRRERRNLAEKRPELAETLRERLRARREIDAISPF